MAISRPATKNSKRSVRNGILVVGARQRAHFGRICVHESRIQEAVFGEFLEQLDLQFAGAVARLERDARLRAQLAQIGHVARPGHVESRHVLGHRFDDRDAPEGLVEIVFAPLVVELALADDHVGQALHRALHHDDEVVVVGVGHVQLEHGELGVVPRRHALVAEIAVDLVHALQAADDQALEEQLRRDAQVHVHVERVVMRRERPRRRAARNGLQHRRLDLEEIHRVEEVAQVLAGCGCA